MTPVCVVSHRTAQDLVQKLAGHRHMHVTARYAHPDEEATRAVIEAIDRRHGS
jgi:hypothetical protein